MTSIQSLTFVGSGRVASILSKAFSEAGVIVYEIISRNKDTGKELASKLSCFYQPVVDELKLCTDLIIIAVNDSSIQEVLKQLPSNIPVVHTSGSTTNDVFEGFDDHGVIYPPQSFSKGADLDLKNTPFFIEGNSPDFKQSLMDLVEKISNKVYSIEQDQRVKLHMAAIFANNFSNHMFKLAFDFLKEAELPEDTLVPIIEETVKKIKIMSPSEAQTGPALRKDELILKKHLNLLEDKPELKNLYRLITQSIQNTKD